MGWNDLERCKRCGIKLFKSTTKRINYKGEWITGLEKYNGVYCERCYKTQMVLADFDKKHWAEIKKLREGL